MANEMWLIDAKKFNKKIEHIPMWGSVASYMLEHFPTVDAKPVVHGRWVEDTTTDMIVCTECGHAWNIIDNCTETFNYCPNCGAKMDGDGNE